MKNIISVIAGKLAIIIGKLVKRGSVFPGNVAKKINPDIFNYFKLPKLVIAVTGSSGKGGISSMITEVLRKSGYTVAYNDKGSNIDVAVLTMLLENCDLKGNIKTDAVVYEMDERYAKYVMPIIEPTFCVITNITRDQPPRQGHVDIVYGEILKALNNNTTLVINGDDPYLMKLSLNKKFNIKYYGIDKYKYSYIKNKFDILNIDRCPECNAKLVYDYYNIESLGNYKCSCCNFKRPNIDFSITKFVDNKIIINNEYEVTLTNDILYRAYNTLAAFTALSLCGINNLKIASIISSLNNNNALYEKYAYNKRMVYLLNNKCENASTYNHSVLYVSNHKENKIVVLGWKEISRRYEFNDISWIYDINFNLLNDKYLQEIICMGPQKYDLATCLKLKGFNQDNIKVVNDFNDMKKEIDKLNGNIFSILNFDYVVPFNETLKGCDNK